MPEPTSVNRGMTADEQHLVHWLLDHGTPEARSFIPQLDAVRVTPWRCPCGCASFNLVLEGRAEPAGGMHILADFVFGDDQDLSGIFVYEQDGVLSGVEIYGLAGDAPKTLPPPEALRPIRGDSPTAP